MSILHIVFPFNADQVGGSAVSSHTLIAALVQQGLLITVVLHGDGPLVSTFDSLGVNVVRVPSLLQRPMEKRADGFHFRNLLGIPQLLWVLWRLKADVVHVNDLSMLRTWAPVAVAARVALVTHWRSNYARSISVYTGLLASQRVIAISRYNEQALPSRIRAKTVVEWNPSNPVITAADRDQARANIRTRLGLPSDSRLIGVFGNHSVRKRTHVLADVIASFAAEEGVYGLACGNRAEPNDHELDRKIAEYKLEKRLIRPGFVSPVQEWIAACDVVLAPSVREPFGRAVFEAAEAGTALIMSNDSGAAEIIEHERNAILLDPEDIPAWIEASRRVLADDGLAQSLVAAARAVLPAYAGERHAERITKIYGEVVSGR